MSDQLFNPADYGVVAAPPKPRREAPPGSTSVTLGGRWELMRSSHGSPMAHLRKTAFGPRELRPTLGAIAGECGVYGVPIGDLDGQKAPACPRCAALARKWGERP